MLNANHDSNSSSSSDFTLRTMTWDKDAHGLFDYESNDSVPKVFKVNSPGNITRDEDLNVTEFTQNKKEETFFLTVENTQSIPKDSLAYFKNEYGNFYLGNLIEESYQYNLSNLIKVQHLLWTPISQKEMKGIKKEYLSDFEYNFKKGDIIRFGRVQFLVTDLHSKNGNSSVDMSDDTHENNNNNNNQFLYPPVQVDDKLEDRICCVSCHKRDNKDDNPLIRLCSCADCNEYFHLNCFKNYVKNSEVFGVKETKAKNLHITSIYNLICEHCKEPLNTFISRKGKIMSTLPYKVDKANNSNYLVLTSLNFIRESVFTTTVIIFYFPLQKEEFFLGRGHEATFRINDISISRVHSKIYMQNGIIKVDDLGSKFGTLLLLKDDVTVDEMKKKKMKIESGRSLFWVE